MGLKSLFSKLSGGFTGASFETILTVDYKGYVIHAQPKQEGSHYYTAGTIIKEFPDGNREHYFIRADTHVDVDSAAQHAVAKAQRIIDEQGDYIFTQG